MVSPLSAYEIKRDMSAAPRPGVMRRRTRTAEERLARLEIVQSLLADVAHDLGPAIELEPVLDRVLEAMRSMVDFRGGAICLVEDGHVRVAASDPPLDEQMLTARVPVGSGLSGSAVATGQPVYSPDIRVDLRMDPELRRIGSRVGIVTYLAVPLVCVGEVVGVLQIDSGTTDAFDIDDLNVLEGLAIQVAGSIESARRRAQVVELEQLKSDFLNRVSHELRTPLTIISGFTATLLAYDEKLPGDQRQRILERVQTATGRLERLIDELLAVAGFEAGTILPAATEVVVSDLLDTVRAEVPEPELVEVQAPDELVLHTDGRLLRHALRLLVDNALKYAGSATLRARREGGEVWIEVVDQGPGVPAHLRERIFERFTRVDDTRPGLGLGLPLVRMLAGGLGARVDIVDPPNGRGVSFRLTFGG
jgi:signal transduction histidine kinase